MLLCRLLSWMPLPLWWLAPAALRRFPQRFGIMHVVLPQVLLLLLLLMLMLLLLLLMLVMAQPLWQQRLACGI